jgi:hypothetical protein
VRTAQNTQGRRVVGAFEIDETELIAMTLLDESSTESRKKTAR